MSHSIAVLPGDGVGPEVTGAAVAVLTEVAARAALPLRLGQYLVGGAAIDEVGVPLPAETEVACRSADAVLLGAVGGPRWDHLRGASRCEAGLLGLRRSLGVYANLRPIRVHARLASRTPLREEVVRGTDLLIVRELTGGAYFGEPRLHERDRAIDTTVYTRAEVERVTRVACRLARGRRGRLVSVDKANVLATSALWREVVTEVVATEPGVEVEHALVDSFAMRLVSQPCGIDVVVTENLFGDILSDEAAVLAGSLGMLPSASLGESRPGLYEPVHGSAPAIAGRDLANPYGAILSAALLLRHSLGREDLAMAIEAAVDAAVEAGVLGVDLGGSASTAAVTEAVLQRLTLGSPAPAAA
ncbi:MAG: 3-isopropylmalate dehydrogenase [Candidatus Dormibacteria bacterium]